MPTGPRTLIVLATLVLVAAVSSPPAHAHCAGKHMGDHPHCQGNPGSNDGLYEVTVGLDANGDPIGELYPKAGSVQVYEGEDAGGSSKPVQVYFQFLDLDLSYFANHFGPSGANCFGAAPIAGELTALVISEEGDGSALARYWFTAYGHDGVTEVKYQLLMWGDFTGTWRPAATGDSTTVNLGMWQLKIEQRRHKNIACRVGYDFDEGVTIEVGRTN